MTPKTAAPPPSVRRALVAAIVVYFVVSRFVPFGRELLYPLTLLATWIHEMGHGLSAILVGGRFEQLDIFADASGLARTSTSGGVLRGIVAAGGLLAPPIVGSFLLAMSRGPRRARIFLLVLAATIVLSLVVWVRSTVGFITLPLLAGLLALFISNRIGTPWRRMVFAQFLGVVLAIDTVTRIDYLFTKSVKIAGEELPSDIATVASSLGGHYLFWGIIFAATAFSLLALGLRSAWRAA